MSGHSKQTRALNVRTRENNFIICSNQAYKDLNYLTLVGY